MDTKHIANHILNPKYIGENWFPHELYTELRAQPKLVWLEPDDIDPFWAIVKHADISEISTQPDKFLSKPRPFVQSREMEKWVNNNPMRTLLNMDPPEHRDYRKVVQPWFVPRNIKKLEDRMRHSAVELVDMMGSAGTWEEWHRARPPSGWRFPPRRTWEGDFVFDIAAIHPVRLITHLLGLPDEDEGYLIKLANETFGSEDNEFSRGAAGIASLMEAVRDAIGYFGKLMRDRRAHPTEDLASVISNAKINGELLPPLGVYGYLIVILTAGHETTRTAMSTGMHALLQNPDELRKLQENPDLVDSAVEEMIRWASPVSQFGRTALQDYELRGTTIKAGESVCMFYGSGNRDEEVFEDPFAFRVDRNPNPHLAFGIGEHFCLGASLARLEMKVFFDEFTRRADVSSIEQTREAQYMASNFVGGVKHLPMKCRITKAAA